MALYTEQRRFFFNARIRLIALVAKESLCAGNCSSNELLLYKYVLFPLAAGQHSENDEQDEQKPHDLMYSSSTN